MSVICWYVFMEKPQPGRICKTENTKRAANPSLSRYESQKKRDWNTFGQYLKNHRPPLALARCSGAHVLEFLRYLDQFGKTKVHHPICPFFGHPAPPSPCPCPLKQAWGSLDALVGRLRAAFEENGGQQEANPFGARAVRLYLRDVREQQAKARGISYEKKRRNKSNNPSKPTSSCSSSSSSLTMIATAPPELYWSLPSPSSLAARDVIMEHPGFCHQFDHILMDAPVGGSEEISFTAAGGSAISLSVLN